MARVFDTKTASNRFWAWAFFLTAVAMPFIPLYAPTNDDRRFLLTYTFFASPVLAALAGGIFLHMHNARVEVMPEQVVSYNLFGKVRARLPIDEITGWHEARKRHGRSWYSVLPVLHTANGHHVLPGIRERLEFIFLLREYNPGIPLKANYSHLESKKAPEPYDSEAGWRL